MTDGFHQTWLTLSRLISKYKWRQMCFAEILLLYHLVIAQIHNDPLQGDLHPSNYHERKRRWGDAAHPGFHFHFLKLHTTHHIVHLTGASHYERPVDPRIEADVFEGLKAPWWEVCDRDAILWQLWYWWCWLCGPSKWNTSEARSCKAATYSKSRHRQIFEGGISWNKSSSQRRRLIDPLIKALMCVVINDRSVQRRCNFEIKLLLASFDRWPTHCF